MRPTSKSGGRQPAAVGKLDAVRRKSPTVRRRCDARTRAAGVSPPWSVNRTQCGENRPPFDHDDQQERRASARRGAGNRAATATDFSEPSTFAPARSLSIPRLAYTSRSWLRARMLLLTCVSYPQVRYPFPRLAYASRSRSRDVCSVRNATFAMHKRTPTRAAGVSPPWVGKPNAVRRKSPTIRPRCDARTRAAGVSPPWYRKSHLQRRPTFPSPARSPQHGRFPSHGWLTPAAPGCERGCCC
jgi:hypothetical protein